jgi:hypothetical protein
MMREETEEAGTKVACVEASNPEIGRERLRGGGGKDM